MPARARPHSTPALTGVRCASPCGTASASPSTCVPALGRARPTADDRAPDALLRRFAVHPLLRPLLPAATLDPMNAPMRALFTCARLRVGRRRRARLQGRLSLASAPCPWWLDGEVADGREVVEWIVGQPWSNGLVGSTGVSYEGTTAEFLATVGHPAVRAMAPRFSLFNVYTDVAFPAGSTTHIHARVGDGERRARCATIPA